MAISMMKRFVLNIGGIDRVFFCRLLIDEDTYKLMQLRCDLCASHPGALTRVFLITVYLSGKRVNVLSAEVMPLWREVLIPNNWDEAWICPYCYDDAVRRVYQNQPWVKEG